MAIDLNNFRVVKFGNIDAERNYINDILHAIVSELANVKAAIAALSGSSSGDTSSGSFVTVDPEINLADSRQLTGESGVIAITDSGPTSTIEVGIEDDGVDTVKIADGAVTIPKIDATGTPDATTFLRGDGAWAVADKHYVHTQSTPSDTWTIVHNLGKYPAVAVVDTAKTVVMGTVTYDSISQCTITFTAAFSGSAYLN